MKRISERALELALIRYQELARTGNDFAAGAIKEGLTGLNVSSGELLSALDEYQQDVERRIGDLERKKRIEL